MAWPAICTRRLVFEVSRWGDFVDKGRSDGDNEVVRRGRAALAAVGVVIGLVAGILAALSSPTAAATLKWSIVPTTSSPTCQNCAFGDLYGVSCPTTTVCMATGAESRLLVRTPNSHKWSQQITPSKAALSAVSCATTKFCMAIAFTRKPVVERWNGTHWKTVPIAIPHNATDTPSLFSLSCTSPTFCVAVGGYATSYARAWVERWDGTSWSVVPNPRPPGRSPDGPGAWITVLTAVSCTSATNCLAAGQTYPDYFVAGAPFQMVAERWNGVRWSIVPTPHVSRSVRTNAMSCTSTSNCMAVGYSGSAAPSTKTDTFTAQWNGNRWSIVASPNTTALQNTLYGVSCIDAKHCMAVGKADRSDPNASKYLTQTLTEHWDGTGWAIVASPNPPARNAINESSLAAVSCTNATACMAVGYAPPTEHSYLSLAEQYG